MKKIVSISLAIAALLSICLMAGCTEEKLKFGMGVYSVYADTTNAEGENPGSVDVDQTIAAVTLDKDGKIVACDLDTVSLSLGFTSDGKYVGSEDIKSKYEMGDNYNMVNYGKAKYEWYQQADNFSKLVVGKTIDEVKALVADGNKGNDEVVNAGCTIMISDFVFAIEKAVKNAVESDVTKDDKVQVAIVATQGEYRNATADVDGINEIESAFCAVAVDKDGMVKVMSSDATTVTASFGDKGEATTDTSKEIVTKKELGTNYGMSAIGKKEWNEQAAAFDSVCIGNTAEEIVAFEENGYGNLDIKNAGCTIAISDMVKAAVKAATIA